MNIVRFIIVIFISIICLSGCMNQVIRFWNNGGAVSEEQSRLFEKCFKKVEKRFPVPDHSTERERIDRLILIDKCMKATK
ncbi:Uncharacterised protein [Phocoenobacter uteri]|uniref:Uncharacterized protein n=1 Tax=Phocoenobacter uteri TaxID=146806 RepID=A0A379CBT5_9PAST|nr:hypothetical protein [Phocoenobacter uteri]MDG6881144.1 hypothetical protein [Phocoenobacter uteri]SUB59166.1 Uncharacterised protein [Phocoenobacter uteri]